VYECGDFRQWNQCGRLLWYEHYSKSPHKNRKYGSFFNNWGAAENEVLFQNLLLQESSQLSPVCVGFHSLIWPLHSVASVNSRVVRTPPFLGQLS